MTPQNFIDERPIAPPSTSGAEMKEEVDEVKWYSQHLTSGAVGDHSQMGRRCWYLHTLPDIGTISLPNTLLMRDTAKCVLHAFALLNMAMHDAAVGCWETKFYYFNPRPSQMDASIKTGTGVPNFPAFTSDNVSSGAATVLSYLFPSGKEYFMPVASEASLSRLYGAIHYRSDIEAGMSALMER